MILCKVFSQLYKVFKEFFFFNRKGITLFKCQTLKGPVVICSRGLLKIARQSLFQLLPQGCEAKVQAWAQLNTARTSRDKAPGMLRDGGHGFDSGSLANLGSAAENWAMAGGGEEEPNCSWWRMESTSVLEALCG